MLLECLRSAFGWGVAWEAGNMCWREPALVRGEVSEIFWLIALVLLSCCYSGAVELL